MRRITLITTGGTIEKTFNEDSGAMENRRSVVHRMLRRLRLEETEVCVVELMSKDSLYMTDDDRAAIAAAVREGLATSAGVVVLHGTDTLEKTGACLAEAFPAPGGAIILTGAMRPFEMTRSDAVQNLTEALFAVGVLSPGVYCVTHGRALKFPGVVKDRERRTFIRRP
ncbi:MAG: asparaginase [Phycisphaerae bacterium]|nr:MAG: asparaginase [Phycisphaerae bacterium]